MFFSLKLPDWNNIIQLLVLDETLNLIKTTSLFLWIKHTDGQTEMSIQSDHVLSRLLQRKTIFVKTVLNLFYTSRSHLYACLKLSWKFHPLLDAAGYRNENNWKSRVCSFFRMRMYGDGAFDWNGALPNAEKTLRVVSSGSGAGRAGLRARTSHLVVENFRFYFSIPFFSFPL